MFHWPLGWYYSYCAAQLVTRTSDRKQNKTSLHTVYFVIKLHFKSNLPPPISEGFHFHFVSCLFSLQTWWVSRLVREYLVKFYAPKSASRTAETERKGEWAEWGCFGLAEILHSLGQMSHALCQFYFYVSTKMWVRAFYRYTVHIARMGWTAKRPSFK